MQRLSAITHAGFGLFRVRSPLLTESRLFSFPVGTEMFHFPTFPPATLCVQVEVAGHYSGFFRGFPIRRSTDQSSFTSSPWLIAGYNVLHRLLMPRHPPIALSSLLFHYKDARVHCAVLKKRAGPVDAPASAGGSQLVRRRGLPIATDPSGPNSVPSGFVRAGSWFHSPKGCTDELVDVEASSQCSTSSLLPVLDVRQEAETALGRGD